MATGNNSAGLSLSSRNTFWEVVEECLVEFHQLHRPDAIAAALDFRRQFESAPAGIDGDLVYHDEPFYVACGIAGLHDVREQERLLQGNEAKYDSLLAVYRW